MTCPDFWATSPMILVKEWREFFPFTEVDKQCTTSALNSLTRFGIYSGLLIALVKLNPRWLLLSVAIALFTLGMWKYMDYTNSIHESFLDVESPIVDPDTVNGNYVPDIVGSTVRTEPTPANPFMNVLLTEYTDNPLRYAASSDTSFMDTYFDTLAHTNPGDVFQRTQGQRQFVTMPSTTIPNDQESFMNWLYRTPGKTCKEGNTDACVFTANSQFPWREIK